VLIVDLFFNVEEEGSITKARTLDLFKPAVDDGIKSHSSYVVKAANLLHFHLAVHYLSHGLWFRQIAAMMNSTKYIARLIKLGCMSDIKASENARMPAAINLQIGSLIPTSSGSFR